MKRSVLAILTLTIGLQASALSAFAQKIHDINGRQPTSAELVEILRPRMRGIALASQSAATCAEYRQTRGIAPVGVTPVADIAALHVTFAFNSAQVMPDSIPTLRRLGEALQNSELDTSCIQIEGHTDSVGSDNYNLKLSQRRAESVVRYLVQNMGIKVDRLVAVGKGEQTPIADNATDDGRQKNRRVQIVNLGYAKVVARDPR